METPGKILFLVAIPILKQNTLLDIAYFVLAILSSTFGQLDRLWVLSFSAEDTEIEVESELGE